MMMSWLRLRSNELQRWWWSCGETQKQTSEKTSWWVKRIETADFTDPFHDLDRPQDQKPSSVSDIQPHTFLSQKTDELEKLQYLDFTSLLGSRHPTLHPKPSHQPIPISKHALIRGFLDSVSLGFWAFEDCLSIISLLTPISPLSIGLSFTPSLSLSLHVFLLHFLRSLLLLFFSFTMSPVTSQDVNLFDHRLCLDYSLSWLLDLRSRVSRAVEDMISHTSKYIAETHHDSSPTDTEACKTVSDDWW